MSTYRDPTTRLSEFSSVALSGLAADINLAEALMGLPNRMRSSRVRFCLDLIPWTSILVLGTQNDTTAAEPIPIERVGTRAQQRKR